MTDSNGLGGIRDDLSAACGICQLFVVGHRNAVDDKDPNARCVLDPGALGVRDLVRGQRNTVFEDVGLLAFRPLVSKRGEALEITLVNHIREKSLGLLKQGVCEVSAGTAPIRPRLSIRIWVCLKGIGTLESNRCDGTGVTT